MNRLLSELIRQIYSFDLSCASSTEYVQVFLSRSSGGERKPDSIPQMIQVIACPCRLKIFFGKIIKCIDLPACLLSVRSIVSQVLFISDEGRTTAL
jgi:hypothetical protein